MIFESIFTGSHGLIFTVSCLSKDFHTSVFITQSVPSFQIVRVLDQVNWGAWSLTLYCPMRNAGQMTIGKTHPRLKLINLSYQSENHPNCVDLRTIARLNCNRCYCIQSINFDKIDFLIWFESGFRREEWFRQRFDRF